jgi:hypothetical protein
MIIKNLYELGVDKQLKDIDTQEKWNYYEEVKNKFHEQCFSRNFISYYAPCVRDMLNTYTRANIIGSFGNEDYLNNPLRTYREWDKNKYYTSILKDLPFIPYVNEFENFEYYSNEPIQDHIFILWKRKTNCKAIRYIHFRYASV